MKRMAQPQAQVKEHPLTMVESNLNASNTSESKFTTKNWTSSRAVLIINTEPVNYRFSVKYWTFWLERQAIVELLIHYIINIKSVRKRRV